MIDKILDNFNRSDFDFRKYANPSDELAHLFDDWIPYYRLKYSLCKAIGPQSILEIGVRYGYSAATFLEATPNATYIGIDNDSTSFGGAKGAFKWAEKITAGRSAEFLLLDTQKITSLPGEFYDLIHIDGQQDGDGTYHDLEMALEKGHYILIDGYFWSKENMLSSTFFLQKYRNFIEYAIVLPGYAGELLIKTKQKARSAIGRNNGGYEKLKDTYVQAYFLEDCGGYDSFKKHKGVVLEDSRLLTLYYLAEPKPNLKILDVGCGRGELSFALAKARAIVTGIDYSKDAIEIAQKTFNKIKDDLGLRLEYLCCDIFSYDSKQGFDRIVAADFVEHLEQDALDRMLQKISTLLKKDGLFVVHTSPNKLNYSYAYKRRRELAKKAGLYLPDNPRTYYEDLMHINEQTPSKLNRSLKKYFNCVYTWTTSLPDPSGSLGRSYSRKEYAQATSVYAIASHQHIARESILSLITQQKLTTNDLDVEIDVKENKLIYSASMLVRLKLTVRNMTRQRIASLQPYPIHISYHWLRRNGEVEVSDGIRTSILIPLMPNEKRDFTIDILTPSTAGEYVLQITLVQERNYWFEQFVDKLPLSIETTVTQ